MKVARSFEQKQLIKQTGNIYPSGICLGLAAYWLISCRHHDENQFWVDIEESITPPQDKPISSAPLIYGKGYAAKAAVFHEQNDLADLLVRLRQEMVIKGKMGMLHNETVPANFFRDNLMEHAISKILQHNDTYTVLTISGSEPAGHAIGVRHNKGKAHVFDPNFFVLECTSPTDLKGELKEAFLTLDHNYQSRFNKQFSLEVFC